MFIEYNPNPHKILVGDCVIRAVSKIVGTDWDTAYLDIADMGFRLKDMPSGNRVWGEYLKRLGFKRNVVPDTCPGCYTVKDFCNDYPYGDYIVATGEHVIAIVDGDYFDSFDSGSETPIFYYRG